MGRRLQSAKEEYWYTNSRRREEVLTVAALRVAPMSTTTLRIPIRGKPVPSAADDDLEDEEIPSDPPGPSGRDRVRLRWGRFRIRALRTARLRQSSCRPPAHKVRTPKNNQSGECDPKKQTAPGKGAAAKTKQSLI